MNLFCCCIGTLRRSSSWVRSASSWCLESFNALKMNCLRLQCVYLCLMLPRRQHLLHLHSKFWNHHRVCPCWTVYSLLLLKLFRFPKFVYAVITFLLSFSAFSNLFQLQLHLLLRQATIYSSLFFRVSSATLKIAYLIL